MRRQRWAAAALVALGVGAVSGLGSGSSMAGAQDSTAAEDVVTVDAAADLLDVVAAGLLAEGSYVEDGARVAAGAVAEAREAMLAAGSEWGLVALSTPPPRGTRNFAANLLAEVRSSRSRIDTVIVLTLEDVTGASMSVSDADLDRALEAAIPVLEQDVAAGWGAVYEQVTGTALPPPGPSGDGDGLPVTAMLLSGIVAGGAVVGVVVARSRAAQRAEHL